MSAIRESGEIVEYVLGIITEQVDGGVSVPDAARIAAARVVSERLAAALFQDPIGAEMLAQIWRRDNHTAREQALRPAAPTIETFTTPGRSRVTRGAVDNSVFSTRYFVNGTVVRLGDMRHEHLVWLRDERSTRAADLVRKSRAFAALAARVTGRRTVRMVFTEAQVQQIFNGAGDDE